MSYDPRAPRKLQVYPSTPSEQKDTTAPHYVVDVKREWYLGKRRQELVTYLEHPNSENPNHGVSTSQGVAEVFPRVADDFKKIPGDEVDCVNTYITHIPSRPAKGSIQYARVERQARSTLPITDEAADLSTAPASKVSTSRPADRRSRRSGGSR